MPRGALVMALLLLVGSGGLARASDAVDQAFVAGNASAAQKRWTGAVQNYERARKLSPGLSAELSYNLGTAYAHLGKLGYATVHLKHALELTHDAQLAEAARQNLGLLRRQAQTQAKVSGRVLSEPTHWSSVVVAFVGSSAVGWLSVLLWWVVAGFAGWRVRKGAGSGGSWTLVFGLVVAALLLSLGYGLARRELGQSEFIVVGDTLGLREGPGEHRSMLFEVQPASQVRLLQESSGWAQVRLPGARQGWIQKRALAPLQPGAGSIPVGLNVASGPERTAKPGQSDVVP